MSLGLGSSKPRAGLITVTIDGPDGCVAEAFIGFRLGVRVPLLGQILLKTTRE
jgi:hypothetical protein